MRKTMLTLGILAVSAALALPAAFAQPEGAPAEDSVEEHFKGKRGKRGKRGFKLQRMAQELSLTPEQTEQVKTLKTQVRADNKALKTQLRAERKALRALWDADPVDADAVYAAIDRMTALKAQLKKNKADMKLGLRAVLNPEQRAKLKTLKKERRAKWGKRGKRGKWGKRGKRGGNWAEEAPAEDI